MCRPFLRMRNDQLFQLGKTAIESNDIETGSFAILEAERRNRSDAHAALKVLASVRGLPILPWLEDAYTAAASFRGSNRGRRRVYVILLGNSSGEYGLYVGQTGKTREERFAEHKAGYRASRHVRNHGISLLDRLHSHIDNLETAEADRIEADLANAFRMKQIWTEGGH